jgi:hypothetical protein
MRRGCSLCFVVALGLLTNGVFAEPVQVDNRASESQAPDLFDDGEMFQLHGPIIDRVATRDTDKFKRDILRAGMMVHYASPYEFLAVGASRNVFRQGNWSGAVNSLVLAGRDVNRRTAEGVVGRLALTTNTEKINWHGEASWNHRFTERTGMELVGSRDAVETIGALAEGIVYNFVGLSVDHALTDRLTMIGMPTYQRFNDGNSRRGWRGWLIYSLVPDWGLGAEIKAQAYDSTGSSHGLYFNPENYERREIGLRLRRAIGGWRLIASLAAGQERIDREIEKPTRTMTMTMQKTFTSDVTAGLQFSYYQASSSGTDIASSDDYAWRMGRAFVAVAF